MPMIIPMIPAIIAAATTATTTGLQLSGAFDPKAPPPAPAAKPAPLPGPTAQDKQNQLTIGSNAQASGGGSLTPDFMQQLGLQGTGFSNLMGGAGGGSSPAGSDAIQQFLGQGGAGKKLEDSFTPAGITPGGSPTVNSGLSDMWQKMGLG
jgi:hypothetical protein